MGPGARDGSRDGLLGYMARNHVAANLLMVLVMAGGLVAATTIKREVFPEFSLDIITVTVPYLGAAPEEVEAGVCVRIEEALQGLDGIKRVTSTAAEGTGTVVSEIELGADASKVLDDVKSRVDAIDAFPEPFAGERILFGTGAPFKHVTPALLKLETADLPPGSRARIRGATARRLLGLEG